MRSLVPLLALLGTAHARPVTLAAGVELGGWPNIQWNGGAAELDVPVSAAFSARVAGRWQHLDDEVDECGLNFYGRQLDAIAGVRWDSRASDDSHIAPFFAAGAGIGREETHDTCPGGAKVTTTHTAAVIEASGGADLWLSPRLSLRLEGRVVLAGFRDGGPADTVTNHELSAALLIAVRL